MAASWLCKVGGDFSFDEPLDNRQTVAIILSMVRLTRWKQKVNPLTIWACGVMASTKKAKKRSPLKCDRAATQHANLLNQERIGFDSRHALASFDKFDIILIGHGLIRQAGKSEALPGTSPGRMYRHGNPESVTGGQRDWIADILAG